MRNQIKTVVALVAICAVVAVMMALTNYITAPLIKENEEQAVNEALREVMPAGEGFEVIDISSLSLPLTVVEAYREQGGGYVFKLNTTGYSSGMVIMCGVSADGTVSGAVCLASTETLGYEKTYGDGMKGVSADSVDAVDVVSGATKTTAAYKGAVKDALLAFETLRGGK